MTKTYREYKAALQHCSILTEQESTITITMNTTTTTLVALVTFLSSSIPVLICQPSSIEAFQYTSAPRNHQRKHHGPSTNTNTNTNAKSKSKSVVELNGFLDGLFGGGGDSNGDDEAVLATFDITKNVDAQNAGVRFESLSDYITQKWIRLFEDGTISLTTPVLVTKGGDASADDASTTARCKLVFQKIDTGYKSNAEEKATGGYTAPATTTTTTTTKLNPEEKKKEPKQGGIEILVEQENTKEQPSLRVTARRCDVDENTIVKEMSEEVVVSELQKAIEIWKKESDTSVS